MCARLTSLLLATACVAGVGCASKPAEEPSAAAKAMDQACATSSTASQGNDHDTDIDSILTQPTSDRRLAQINRRMYQSLRTLDAELRREQRLAACQAHSLDSAVLQAQTNAQDASGGAAAGQGASDAGVAVGGTAHATADGAIGTSAIGASSPVTSNAAASGAAATGAAHATSVRKARLSNGRGGNGATASKVVPGNDNDIVARRLRKAAEQETNPALRAKLWKEYTDYRQGTSAK